MLRRGAPWRDLPACYGRWTTVYGRFRRWREADVGDHGLRELPAEAAHDGTLDDTVAFIDGTTIRAHQHAAGDKKGAPTAHLDAVGGVGQQPPPDQQAPGPAHRRWTLGRTTPRMSRGDSAAGVHGAPDVAGGAGGR